MVATSWPLVARRFETRIGVPLHFGKCAGTPFGVLERPYGQKPNSAKNSPVVNIQSRSKYLCLEACGRELLQFVVTVEGFDGAHGARSRAHDEGLRSGAKIVEAHAAQEITIGDGGRGEVAVVARHEVIVAQHSVEVVAEGFGESAFVIVARMQDALYLATESLQGGGRDDAFGCAADAEEYVGARAWPGGRDGTGDVAVRDQKDSRAGLAHFFDELIVSRAVENHHTQLLDGDLEPLGHFIEIVGR